MSSLQPSLASAASQFGNAWEQVAGLPVDRLTAFGLLQSYVSRYCATTAGKSQRLCWSARSTSCTPSSDPDERSRLGEA